MTAGLRRTIRDWIVLIPCTVFSTGCVKNFDDIPEVEADMMCKDLVTAIGGLDREITLPQGRQQVNEIRAELIEKEYMRKENVPDADPWGNPIWLEISDDTLTVLSFGPNKTDDGGKGDDIIVTRKRKLTP